MDKFLSNSTEKSFLSHINNCLSNCNSFYFSVSFIKKAGLVLLLDNIVSALSRGVVGKLITSTYQNFTDIASLEVFLNLSRKYPKFKCHLDMNSFGDKGFHTKGYLFEYNDSYEFVVGSSNITRYALKNNIEWNVSIISKELSNSFFDAKNEFESLWKSTYDLNPELISNYEKHLVYAIEKWDMDYFENFEHVTPNYMQRKALKELRRYRDMGVTKALVVAATGSGKTYLAAFDVRNFAAKKILFVVHKDVILHEALMTFKKVFGSSFTYGMYTGKSQEIDADFIFSTNIMISKHKELFHSDHFDYIILDECHHSTAKSYMGIISYFEPEFLLGLTATPERMDNQNVFELFDKNVPYELRLRDALLNDLIVPFRYYGIRDIHVDYDTEDDYKLIRQLSTEKHCNFISDKINLYRPSGKIKALAFCKSIEHARIMSENMAILGYKTTYLTSVNNLGERIKAFNDLQNDLNPLEFIFAVDILNEGVDIPSVNLVLFLRPTDSSTVFIQQLGRGLRKYDGKEYLTVIDFIGNSYKRSVQIIMALGSLSKNSIMEKPLLVNMLDNNFSNLDLNVSITFDEISKKEILEYIKATNFNKLDFLKQDYLNFKKFIGCTTYPTHSDFLNCEYAPDLMRLIKSKINNKKNKCFHIFLINIKEVNLPYYDESQIEFLCFISEMLPLVRGYDFLIFQILIESQKTYNEIKDSIIMSNFHGVFRVDQLNHALSYLTNKTYISENSGVFHLNVNLSNSVFKNEVTDIIEYGLNRYMDEFGIFSTTFKLYGNYYKEQIMMVLNQNGLMYVKGTKIEEDGTVYIFAGLNKDHVEFEHLKYRDKFISKDTFQWESETNVTLVNKVGKRLLSSKIAHLFIRKIESEDGITLPFTYIGTGKLTNPRVSDNEKCSLLFDVYLDHSIPDYLKNDFLVPIEKMN